MIPIHRWALKLGTHFDDPTDALPPSHFPTFGPALTNQSSCRGIDWALARVPDSARVTSEQVGTGSGVGFTAWG